MMTIQNALRCLLLLCALAAVPGMASDEASVPRGQLPRTVVPTHYALALRIDPRAEGFSGDVRIQVRIAEPRSRFWMHAQGLDIASASYRAKASQRDVPLTFSVVDISGVLQIDARQPLPTGEGELHFVYRAKYDAQLRGTYKIKVADESYVMTQMESTSARSSFPCFDEPAFKTPWDVELTVPASDAAVANTRQVSSKSLRKGWKRLRFARTEALPTYLLAYAVGPWDIVSAPDLPPNAQRKAPLPMRGIAVKGRGRELAYALETTPAMVTALEDYFGSAFPFDKLDLLAAPDFGPSAMENAGLILFDDSLLLIDDASPVYVRQGYFDTNVHELAHQWFGDLVTMPWWDDIWLNEGFASWMASKITSQLRPEYYSDRQRVQSTLYAMSNDALASARQIREPIRDFTEIEAAFDGITYSKGEAVLTMFESYLGAERFREGIRDYLDAHARGNATSDDLIDAISARSDQPVRIAAAMRSFLDQSGVPMLAIDSQCANGKTTLSVQQSRYLPLGSAASAARSWGVPMCLRYSTGGRIEKYCALIDTETAKLELPTDGCPDWLMPNAEGAGYYRFALDSTAQRALDAAFNALDEREQRLTADALSAALNAGKLPLDDFVAAVPRLASARTRQVSLAPWRTLDWMQSHLAATEAEQYALRKFIADSYAPAFQRLGFDPRDDDDDEARLTRAALMAVMSYDARDPATRAELAKRARRLIGMDGNAADASAIASDLHDNALYVLVQDGGKAEFDAVERHFRSSADSVERRNCLVALAATLDPDLLARTFALSLDPALKSGEVAMPFWVASDSVEAAAAASAWVRAHVDELMARVPKTQQRYLLDADVTGACSVARADSLERFWGPRLKHTEGGPRELAQSSERIRACSVLKDHYAKQNLLLALKKSSPADVAATQSTTP